MVQKGKKKETQRSAVSYEVPFFSFEPSSSFFTVLFVVLQWFKHALVQHRDFRFKPKGGKDVWAG